jgi:hypothetical protein
MTDEKYQIIVTKESCSENALSAMESRANELLNKGFRILGSPYVLYDSKADKYSEYVCTLSVYYDGQNESLHGKAYKNIIGRSSYDEGAIHQTRKEVNNAIEKGFIPIGSVTRFYDQERDKYNQYMCIQCVVSK